MLALANRQGLAGTDRHTELIIYKPQNRALQVTLMYLPSNQDNSADGFTPGPIEAYPWEAFNLWDALGPYYFNARGQTGALLAYADRQASGCPSARGDTSCDFAVFARTYTLKRGAGARFSLQGLRTRLR